MGLNKNAVELIFYFKNRGVDFSKTAMIGRQVMHLSKKQLYKLAKNYTYSLDINKILYDKISFAEEFFYFLGAKEVVSFDYSDYEGATYVHDMNKPIPKIYHNQYSVVIDGGSLEHIFNFPVAIENCMKMLKQGGYFISITPANNFLGHGFYQFSPELFFSLFNENNGFEIIDIIAYEHYANSTYYRVESPIKLKQRVTLSNSFPLFLFVVAKKISNANYLKLLPQQSDYLNLWDEKQKHKEKLFLVSKLITKLKILLAKITPMPVKYYGKLIMQALSPKKQFNPNFFKPFSPCRNKKKL